MDEREIDFYQTYDAERYIHYREIPTGKVEIVKAQRNGKLIDTQQPINKRQKLSFKEVKELNLDNYGQDIRTSSDDFTLVHNYLLDFWSPIMGSDAVLLYIQLKRYCYGGKDFCYPPMDTICFKMKRTRTTVNKNMDILEKYGFIVKIQRLDTKKNNNNASPFFKVRRYIPVLTEELINELPKKLQELHERFLAKANGIELDKDFEPQQFINDLLVSSQEMQSKKQKDKEEELKRSGKFYEYIISKLTSDEREKWSMILQNLQNKVSKPSFETWLQPSIILLNVEQRSIRIYCANSFSADWLKNHYKDLITNAVKEVFNIDLFYYECELYDDFKTR